LSRSWTSVGEPGIRAIVEAARAYSREYAADYDTTRSAVAFRAAPAGTCFIRSPKLTLMMGSERRRTCAGQSAGRWTRSIQPARSLIALLPWHRPRGAAHQGKISLFFGETSLFRQFYSLFGLKKFPVRLSRESERKTQAKRRLFRP
jgi:hypothetical protein